MPTLYVGHCVLGIIRSQGIFFVFLKLRSALNIKCEPAASASASLNKNVESPSDSLVPVTVSADKNQVKRSLENELKEFWSKMKAVPICISSLT